MSEKWMRDTGLVLGLVCLILGYSGNKGFLVASGVLIVLALLAPKALYPLAWLWLKLVFALNLVVPKIFFGLVFFLIVLPMGLIRKLVNKDPLLVRGWKDSSTAFHDRNIRFTKEHLEVPY